MSSLRGSWGFLMVLRMRLMAGVIGKRRGMKQIDSDRRRYCFGLAFLVSVATLSGDDMKVRVVLR